jgi:hypothetical protein
MGAPHSSTESKTYQGLAAGDRDDRRAALFHGVEHFLGGEALAQDVGRVLDLAAAGALEVAGEERLEHHDEGVLLHALHLLGDEVLEDRHLQLHR